VTGRRIATLDEAVEALFEFAGPREPGHAALPAMAEAMGWLGNPQDGLRVVHVTGTSGKTSTCYYVRAMLEACGFRTGLTVSPHIEAVNERVQIGGVPLPGPVFCAYLEDLLARLAPMRGRLTYFELVTCLALWAFAREPVDYAVVEVGIGGLRDATNVLFRPDKLAVIGPVGLDHTEKLGSTVAEIAWQKAGIVVPGGTVIVAGQSDEAMAVIERRAAEIGARLIVIGGAGTDSGDGPAFQRQNWAMASAVVRYLAERDGFALPGPADLTRLRGVTPPARYEWFDLPGRRVLLDGAHNPQKMAGLVQSLLVEGHAPMPALATLSAAPPGKVAATVAALAPMATRLVVPEFRLGHDDKVKASVPAADVAAAAARHGVAAQVVPDLGTALATLLAEPAPEVLVTGSLYLAALVRPRLIQMTGEAGTR